MSLFDFHSHYDLLRMVVLASVVGVAMYTDIRWRRIPNLLTFPTIGAGLVVQGLASGWTGPLAGLAGAVLAPALLLLLHGGRGIGMGDLKLAAAAGAWFGPIMALVVTLASAVAGGVLALVWLIRPGTPLGRLLSAFFVGLPLIGRKIAAQGAQAAGDPGPQAMPYGIAIGIGILAGLVVEEWSAARILFG